MPEPPLRTPSGVPAGLPRRGFLVAASAAGLGLLAAGCTSSGDPRTAATPAQADAVVLAAGRQAALVDDYAAASAADASLTADLAPLANQARRQLAALRAAAPGSARTSSSAGASGSAAGSSAAAASSASAGVPAGQDPRGWLRGRVAAAADAHAAACTGLNGPRAALLGSIAAGLRGQDGPLS